LQYVRQYLNNKAFYFIPYRRLKSNGSISWINFIGFEICQSMLLASSLCLILLNMFKSFEKNPSFDADTWAFVSHGILFFTAISLSVYYYDLHYVLFILLFQVGVVLNNLSNYSKHNKFSLIFAILSFTSFLYSFFCRKKPNVENETNNLVTLYNEERTSAALL
jgi:cell division protein FtsW (lipid II flippase)